MEVVEDVVAAKYEANFHALPDCGRGVLAADGRGHLHLQEPVQVILLRLLFPLGIIGRLGMLTVAVLQLFAQPPFPRLPRCPL